LVRAEYEVVDGEIVPDGSPELEVIQLGDVTEPGNLVQPSTFNIVPKPAIITSVSGSRNEHGGC